MIDGPPIPSPEIVRAITEAQISATRIVQGERRRRSTRQVISSRRADLAHRIAVAKGDEPADLVVRGGRVLCVFTREWLEADVAIADGYVAGLGEYEAGAVDRCDVSTSTRVHTVSRRTIRVRTRLLV